MLINIYGKKNKQTLNYIQNKNDVSDKTGYDFTDDKNSYYIIFYREKVYEEFILLTDDLYESIFELKKIEAFNREKKEYNYYKYLNLDPLNPGFFLLFWEKFYKEIYHNNYHRIDGIVQWFENKAVSEEWDNEETIRNVILIIQQIYFARPRTVILDNKRSSAGLFDFFTPNEVGLYQKGDCDVKSLLIIMVLHRLGYDAVMFFSHFYKHAMVGVNINASGNYKQYDGKKYYFVESTQKFPIGRMPFGIINSRKWAIIDFKNNIF